MRKLTWIIAAALLSGVLPLRAQPPAGGAYAGLEQAKLAKLLAELKMSELLEALAQGAGATVEGKELLAKAKTSQALQAEDQAQRDRLLDEAIRIYGELAAMTEKAKGDDPVLRHLRFKLERIVLAGITKVQLHAQRLEYLHERAGDAEAVRKLTETPLRELDELNRRLMDLHDDWNDDPDRMIEGSLWKLEAMIREARYRGAWLRYYHGMALPKDARPRLRLLGDVIDEDVKEFAQAADNSSGVKYESLRLSGAAARELGRFFNARAALTPGGDPQLEVNLRRKASEQYDRARDFLRRADHAEAEPALRMKAKFEYARTYLDQGDFDAAAKQIERFRAEAAKLEGIQAVGVDLQAALLEVRMLTLRAAEIKDADPDQAVELENQAFNLMLELTNKHPESRAALTELLTQLIPDKEPEELQPAQRMLLARKYMGRRTPQGLAQAEKILLSVVDDEDAGPESKASALWDLGAIKNHQKKNLEAAAYWYRLASEYPKAPNAENAAINTVTTYQFILKDHASAKALLVRADFVKKYADALKVLVDDFGQDEPNYLYELGMMKDILTQHKQAIEYFKRIPVESDLYMPARYRILEQRVKDFEDRRHESPSDRRQQARQLASDLESYMKRAQQFAAKPENQTVALEARGWGIRCGVLIATVMKDVGNLTEAVRFADQALKQCEGLPAVEREARTLVVQIKLEQDKLAEVLVELTKLVEENPLDAVDLLLIAVPRIGDRVERLTFAGDEESEELLKKLRPAYRNLSDRLYRLAVAQKFNDEQMLPFRRAWAEAHEAGTVEEATKALKMYQQLQKLSPDQPTFVRGMARCYRKLGKAREAMDLYDRLIFGGLKEKTPFWWRVQLERLQFVMELMTKDPDKDGLNDVRTHIYLLGKMDDRMGGYYKQFNRIAAGAEELAESISPTTQPAGTGP